MASLTASLGLALLRLSHKQFLHRNKKLWLSGYALQGIASLFDVASFGFAPVSLLSCMGAMTLVFNLLLAPAICGEVVSRRDCSVNVLVFVGTVISLWFGPHETPIYNLQELQSMVQTTEAIVYLICLIICLGSMLCLWYWLRVVVETEDASNDITNNHGDGYESHNDENDSVQQYDAEEEEQSEEQQQQLQQHPSNNNHLKNICSCHWSNVTRGRMLRLLYPVLGGSFGGNTVVCAKACVFLVQTSFEQENQFQYGGAYLILASLLVCLVLQLYFLDGGMNRYDAVFVVPIYVCFWITSGIFGALFFFQEIKNLSATDITCFICGVALSLSGILLHSIRPQQQQQQQQSEQEPPTAVETAEEEEEEEEE
eukprot:CAMPEP_0178929742 /NCGR_PEP_ID=MMETSP0786-20121207/20802_1 /TAXON_ID=186022 /ORGANISM="Thalassionema frauenfeldii, Strain CCMP 1798" /LENGTH=369 /DNA_ID=CAMNT_0020606099 /DNA_START=104 /DNA_END=1210 /DNA_ORIENTATION=-